MRVSSARRREVSEMNIHITPQNLTPAEAALVDSFVARASDLPGDGEVTSRRDDAVEQLKAGLPSRKVEAWHYTDLRRLLSKVPAYDALAAPESRGAAAGALGRACRAQRPCRRAGRAERAGGFQARPAAVAGQVCRQADDERSRRLGRSHQCRAGGRRLCDRSRGEHRAYRAARTAEPAGWRTGARTFCGEDRRKRQGHCRRTPDRQRRRAGFLGERGRSWRGGRGSVADHPGTAGRRRRSRASSRRASARIPGWSCSS